ncbi:MAG: GAF domain-containing protein [Mucilaginibacter sp.]|nr:GAF domain-containing protein [Mucilaginibacter sp.]
MHTADLTNCDREPIHIPGKIQSHGFLLAIDTDQKVCYCSENIADHTAVTSAELLGNHIDQAESIMTDHPVKNGRLWSCLQRAQSTQNLQTFTAYYLDIQNKVYQMIASRSDSYILLEFEPHYSDLDRDLQQVVSRSLSEMLSDKNMSNLLNNAADQVKQVIGYERVMIYKFHEDGHGEVVAESKNDGLEPWLGLHYPASDIPKQARELYKKNFVRLIADVDAEPSAILTFQNDSVHAVLDLTDSHLRAVSPLHIQYLKNMGVASSFSVSIIYQNELWGLIACHSYTPRFINLARRETARLIGQVLSSAISFRQQEEDRVQQGYHRKARESITRNLLRNIPIEEALTGQEQTLLQAVYSTGALLYYEGQYFIAGRVPDRPFLDELLDLLAQQTRETNCFHTEKLTAFMPAAAAYKHLAAGIAACRLSRDIQEYMIWFRPEQIVSVKWAGNPDKPIEVDDKGFGHIAPRNSFAVWSQQVELTAESWSKYDLEAIGQLRDEVNYSLSRKASELKLLNEKLREAYAELDTFSYTISHDLKNPLTTIKSFAQLILRHAGDPEKVRSMAGRIEGGAFKMQDMIDEVLSYSKVGQTEVDLKAINMQTLLENLRHDLLIAAQNPDLTIELRSTPTVQGDEMMLLQVFSNLIGNAVKYSSKVSKPRVVVSGYETEQNVTYEIKDNGVGIDLLYHDKIFELFSRSPSGADFEGSGVGLAIVRRMLEKLNGKITLESTPGQGSIFKVNFRKFDAALLLN